MQGAVLTPDLTLYHSKAMHIFYIPASADEVSGDCVLMMCAPLFLPQHMYGYVLNEF
jgi:hypothetical protein